MQKFGISHDLALAGKKLGIFGGSFSPPHLGHVQAARYFAQACALDRVLVMPAGTPPLRPPLEGATPEERLALCGCTFTDPVFEVCDWEINASQETEPSYTIQTVKKVKEQFPEAALFLLIGADQAAQFSHWRDYEELLRLCTVVALAREVGHIPAPDPALSIQILPNFTPLPCSARRIRGQLLLDQAPREVLTDAALERIQSQKLYALERYVAPDRAVHSRAVAEASRELAVRYGADPEKAFQAGLLHDICKNKTLEFNRALCARYGAPLTEEDLLSAQVCHAFAGRARLVLEFGIEDPEILDAVYFHTTGGPGMRLLSEVVFVADLISVDRTFPQVEEIRDLARTNLQQASRAILELSFQGLFEKKRRPHSLSLAWYEELKKL